VSEIDGGIPRVVKMWWRRVMMAMRVRVKLKVSRDEGWMIDGA
jgi:hypothetical protein